MCEIKKDCFSRDTPKSIMTLSVALINISDVFVTEGSRVSAATVASTAIAAAQWAISQVTHLASLTNMVK